MIDKDTKCILKAKSLLSVKYCNKSYPTFFWKFLNTFFKICFQAKKNSFLILQKQSRDHLKDTPNILTSFSFLFYSVKMCLYFNFLIFFFALVNVILSYFSFLQTVICPHKLGGSERVFMLPHNASHIKIIRPKVRINKEFAEWVIFFNFSNLKTKQIEYKINRV